MIRGPNVSDSSCIYIILLAYGFAPASTIAPLGTVSLVSNVIFAPLILKETFRKQDLLGIVLAVFGASVVVVSSKTEEAKVRNLSMFLSQPYSSASFDGGY